MGLEIVPFEPQHLEQLQFRDFEARELALLGDWRPRAEFYRRAGPAWTGFYNGQIIGCCGLLLLWPGVAEAWLVTGELCNQYRLSFHRAVKRGLAQVCRDLGLWRLQAAVHKEHYVSRLWVERLGFAFEGFMPRYGPDGADYVRFGRLTKCLS